MDLRDGLEPPRNQGACPSAAYAVAALKEWEERGILRAGDYFSPQFLLLHRTTPQFGLCEALQIAQTYGIALEDPLYTRLTAAEQIPYAIRRDAAMFRSETAARITTAHEMKTALVLYGVGLVAVPVYNESETPWRPNRGDCLGGSQAMAVCGYDMTGFLLRNSWGTAWGNNGYTTLPFGEFSVVLEAWCVPSDDTPPVKHSCCVGCFSEICST